MRGGGLLSLCGLEDLVSVGAEAGLVDPDLSGVAVPAREGLLVPVLDG